jgi:autotransporter-associated beta strand protein
MLNAVIFDNTGATSVAKTGTGLWVLSAGSTYGGATTVGAGELRVNGDNSLAVGAITVSGGTLSGTGKVGGAATVQTGGTIRGDSGSGTGTLATANVTVQSGGGILANLGATTVSSRLALGSGTLDLKSGSKLSLAGVGFTDVASTYTIATTNAGTLNWNGAAQANGFVFGAYSPLNGNSGPVTIDTTGLGVMLNPGDQFTLSRSNNDLVLNFVPNAVPEPGTILGIAAAGLGLAGWFRRRKAAKA